MASKRNANGQTAQPLKFANKTDGKGLKRSASRKGYEAVHGFPEPTSGVPKRSPASINGLPTKERPAPPTKRERTDEKSEQPVKKKIKGSRRLSSASTPLSTATQTPRAVQTVFVFGNGDNGELGLGPNKTESLRPRSNPFLKPDEPSKFHVIQIACGGMHTIGLTVDNRIITWGVNDNYALGRNTDWEEKLRDVDAESDEDEAELNPLESTPAEVPSHHFPAGTKFIQVAAGDSCSFALTDTGLVFGWGTFRNSKGDECFGYGPDGKPIIKQEKPIIIHGVRNIVQLACGVNHVLALDTAGNIWGWGNNEQNQIGRRLFGRDQDSLVPHQVRVCRNKAKYIASGEYHSFAVDKEDNVWGWGLNSFGEAGDPTTAGTNSAILPYPMKVPDLCGKGVVALDGGAHHSAAVLPDGGCMVWGRMDGGQLGLTFRPEQLQDSTLIRRNERDKPAICLRPSSVPHIGLVSFVACGTDHTLFITESGIAYTTGFGSQGQLGLNSYDDVEVAQQVKGQEVNGKILTWAGAGGQFSVLTGIPKPA